MCIQPFDSMGRSYPLGTPCVTNSLPNTAPWPMTISLTEMTPRHVVELFGTLLKLYKLSPGPLSSAASCIWEDSVRCTGPRQLFDLWGFRIWFTCASLVMSRGVPAGVQMSTCTLTHDIPLPFTQVNPWVTHGYNPLASHSCTVPNLHFAPSHTPRRYTRRPSITPRSHP